MKKKIKEWLKRYIPAEIFATLSALAGAGIVFYITDNKILSAYVGTISENIGFYGFIFIKDVIDAKIHHKKTNRKYTFVSFLKNIRNIFIEFSFAEILDSLMIRPFCMYIFPIIIGNYLFGVFIGKLAADIIFYIPTIISYELRKKHLID